ncbi:hemolysin secretion protein D [Gammaproteobacteria bacterium]|nr:hemolysin secretion protein D [Gammaproteobacteria bacterium]
MDIKLRKPPSKKMTYTLITAIIFCVISAFVLATRPQPLMLQGEAETERVDLALRVSGRVADLNADVGDFVKIGDTLLTLSSPQLDAQLATATATLAVAQADRTRVYSTRPETISAAKSNLERANADLVLAKQSYDRYEQLVGKGGVSQQSFDQASNAYRDATKFKDVAAANYDLALNGSSDEEKALADAQIVQSKALLEQTKTDINELTLIAPAAGQVIVRTAEKGQLFNAGTPVFSIINIKDIWFTFNIREDLLNTIKVGDKFNVKVPALNNQEIQVIITVLNPQGQYANWRATKATGDFDLRTFEMRAKPVNPVEGLRPGMSVLALWKR